MALTRQQLLAAVHALVAEGVDIFYAEQDRQRPAPPAKPENSRSRKKTSDRAGASVAAEAEAASRAADGGASSKKDLPLNQSYHSWYTKALPVVRQILPDRYPEFVEQYKLDKRKEIDFLTYSISDYLLGLRVTRGYYKEEVVNPWAAFSSKFQQQILILQSCADRLESALSDILGTLRAELFDDELDAARDLHKKGHPRAAGALAGVTLERHLASVSINHQLRLTKRDPGIADYNEALKKAEVLDIPNWRFIQRLADIRNLAVHFKERDPTTDEIEELLRGVEKAVKTIH
jgi:hypothetical protein